MCSTSATIFLQVPQHAALFSGFDPTRVACLVRTNWIRTVGWSTRVVIAALIVGQPAGS